MEHMDEKLLKREEVPDQPFERQRFNDLLFVQDLHTAQCGIEMQDDMMTDEVSGDIVAFEIEADHAVAIHFALQVQAIELSEPAIRIDGGRQRR